MPESNIELAGNKNIKTSKVEKSVDTPADFTSPEELYNDLIEKVKMYHPSSDLSDIERACSNWYPLRPIPRWMPAPTSRWACAMPPTRTLGFRM